MAKSRHHVDFSSRIGVATGDSVELVNVIPQIYPYELVAKYKEACGLFKMNWKTRGISFSWKDPFTFHHCHKDVSNLTHLLYGIQISFSVKDFG